jgi:HEAT repeat protein
MSSLTDYAANLNSADDAERTYAAEDIGYLNAPEGVPALLGRLDKEASRTVRDAIFQALMRIDADAAIEGAISLLGSDHPQIRNQAVEVLRHKGAASVPFLKTIMRQGDKDIRKLLLDVLVGFQAGATEEIYAAALSDPDTNVVITAVENLGRTRAAQFRPKIEELLLAPGSHPMLVGACLEALGGIGDQLSLAAIRQRFPELPALPDFFLVPCLKAIGALGTAHEFAEVAGLLAACRPHLRSAILGTLISIHQRHPAKSHGDILLPVIRAVAEKRDPGEQQPGQPLVGYQAVRALGFLSARDDVYSFLISCLSNSERLVRLGAIESLRMGERPALANVLAACALTENDEEVLQALRC